MGNHGGEDERPLPSPRTGEALVDGLGAVSAVAFLTPLMMNAFYAATVTRNFGAAVAAAIGALVTARGFGPWAAHRRVIRLTRRYRSAGAAPNG